MNEASQLCKAFSCCLNKNAVALLDTQLHIQHVSDAFLATAGIPEQEAHGLITSFFDIELNDIVKSKHIFSENFSAVQRKSGKQHSGIAMRCESGYLLIFSEGEAKKTRSQLLLDALNEAAAGMHNVEDIETIYRATAGVLKCSGLESMLFLYDTELFRISNIFHSFGEADFANIQQLIEMRSNSLMTSTETLEAVLEIISSNAPIFTNNTVEFMGKIMPIQAAQLSSEKIFKMNIGKSIIVPMHISEDAVGLLIIMSDDIVKSDIAAVTAYANQIEAAFEKVKLIDTLKKSVDKIEIAYNEHQNLVDRFELAKYVGRIGVWEYDIISEKMIWDDMMYQLYNIMPDGGGNSIALAELQSRIHPDDLKAVIENRENAIKRMEMYRSEFRVLYENGSVRYLKSNGISYTNEAGKAERMVGTTWDITDRVLAEKENRELLDRLEMATKAGGVGIWEIDLIENKLIWDDQMYRLYKVPFDSPIGVYETWEKALHPDDMKRAKLELQNAIEEKAPYDVEFRIVWPDGSIRYIKADGLLRKNDEGRPERIIGTNWDMTDRVAADRAHAETLRRLKLATNAGKVGIWDWNIAANELIWDDQMFTLYDVDPKSFGGTLAEWEKTVHHDDWPEVVDAMEKAIETQSVFAIQFRVVWKNGEVRHLDAYANMIVGESGEVERIVGTNWDITDLVRAEQEHSVTRERLELAATAGRIGIWDVNLIIDELLGDDITYEIFEFQKGKPITSSMWEARVHPDDRERFKNRMQDAKKSNEPYNEEYRIVLPDGGIRYIRTAAVVHKDDVGNAVRMVGANWDITDIRTAQKELDHSEELLQKMFSTLPIGVFYADKNGILTKANPAAKEIWGEVPLDGEEGYKGFKAHRYPTMEELAPEDWAIDSTIKAGEKTQGEMLEIETFDGKKKIIINDSLPLFKDGKVDGAMIINRDITRQQKAEEALYHEKELLRITLQSIGDGVVVTDALGRITMLNSVFEAFSGWTQQEAVGKEFDEVVRIVNEITREKAHSPVEKALVTGRTVALANHTSLIRKDGEGIPIADSAAPIKNETGDILGVVLVMRDITEERRKRQKIDYLVHHDSLTGLFNRRYFEQQLKELNNEEELPLSIISCDVNGLKMTNDSFGHSVGDKLLKTMADTIRKACRKNDIVVRSGGDEFYILLPNTSAKRAEEVCARIKKLVSEVDLGEVDFSLSVGFDTRISMDIDVSVTLKNAEDNMYREKFIEVRSVKDKSIHNVLAALHNKSHRERIHSHRVSEFSRQLGRVLRLDKQEIDELGIVGAMHDIGKTTLSEELLTKKPPYSEDELAEIRRHPEVGFRILRASDEMRGIANDVLAHHERWDGTGYPGGLKGEEIPLKARIIAVANEFISMISEDPQDGGKTQTEALAEVERQAGKAFDPTVVAALNRLFENHSK